MPEMLFLILLEITATLVGRGAASRLAISILFLYFAIPIWDLVIPPLQQTTIAAVSAALHWTGFTALIEGNLIHFRAGTFEIAEGCACLRYLVVSLTLATFYAPLFLRTWAKGLALIAIALASAILCNWIRVYLLVQLSTLVICNITLSL